MQEPILALNENWTPRPHQLSFMNRYDIFSQRNPQTNRAEHLGCKRAVLVHHRRAGKDELLLWALARMAYHRPQQLGEGLMALYMFPFKYQVSDIILDTYRFLKVIPESMLYKGSAAKALNRTKAILTFADGYQCKFAGADNPVGVRGNTYDNVYGSEVQEWKESIWDVINPIYNEVTCQTAVFVGTPNGPHSKFKVLYDTYTRLANPDQQTLQQMLNNGDHPNNYYTELIPMSAPPHYNGVEQQPLPDQPVGTWKWDENIISPTYNQPIPIVSKALLETDRAIYTEQHGDAVADIRIDQEYNCDWRGGGTLPVFPKEMIHITSTVDHLGKPWIRDLRQEGLPKPGWPVDIMVDLGKKEGADPFVAIAMQRFPAEDGISTDYIFLDYYIDNREDYGHAMQWAQQNNYVGGYWIMPSPDFAPRQFEGNIFDRFFSQGWTIIECPPHYKRERHEKIRQILRSNRCWFDRRCALNNAGTEYGKHLISALSAYSMKYDDDNQTESPIPKHWANHFVDAFGYGCVGSVLRLNNLPSGKSLSPAELHGTTFIQDGKTMMHVFDSEIGKKPQIHKVRR